MKIKRALQLSKSYHEAEIERLKNNFKARHALLSAAIKENDMELFLDALQIVIDAQGGLSKIASKADIAQRKLKRMLSEKEMLDLESLTKVIHALNMQLGIVSSAAKRPSKKQSALSGKLTSNGPKRKNIIEHSPRMPSDGEHHLGIVASSRKNLKKA